MAETTQSPLETVLRLCAQAAPEPWYPREFVRTGKVKGEQLSLIIEHLLLDDLLTRTDGNEVTGPGLVLSPRGKAVLRDPEALKRLAEGRSVTEGDRGGIVREALRREQTPYVSRIILGLNVVVFGVGIMLASSSEPVLQAYLTGWADNRTSAFRDYMTVQEQIGGISAASWLRGEWWRVLTACFVHFGLLHLFMNMYMLWVSGGFLEQVWGRVRFLVIYLLSGLFGNAVGVAHDVTGLLAGASTALCGILAAEAIWAWLNKKYLPRSTAERWRNNLMIQVAMIVFISLFSGVSGWGHFGGAVGGALAAICLHFHRFGSNPWRWVALLGLVLLPLLGYGEIQRMRRSEKDVIVFGIRLSGNGGKNTWKAVEVFDYTTRFRNRVEEAITEEKPRFRELIEPLLGMNAGRREELKKAEVAQALTHLAEMRSKWASLLDAVNQAGPYYQPPAREMQDADRETIAAWQKLIELSERCLSAGKSWTEADEKTLAEQLRIVRATGPRAKNQPDDNAPPPKPASDADLKAFSAEFLPQISKAHKELAGVWDDANALRLKEVKNRFPEVVKATLARLETICKSASALADRLGAVGPYKDERAETRRVTARAYLRASVNLFRLFERCLREGKAWTAEDTAKLEDQLEKTIQAKENWLSLVEFD